MTILEFFELDPKASLQAGIPRLARDFSLILDHFPDLQVGVVHLPDLHDAVPHHHVVHS